MRVRTLNEEMISEIGRAFGDYDYGSEKSLADAFPRRDAAAAYICGYVRMALQSVMLYATSERGEGFIAYKRLGERIGLRAGLLLAGAWGNITMLLAALWLAALFWRRKRERRK